MTVCAFVFANPLLFSIELFEVLDVSLPTDIWFAIGCGVLAENIQVFIKKGGIAEKRKSNLARLFLQSRKIDTTVLGKGILHIVGNYLPVS